MRLHADIESYSDLDLKKVGLYKYAAHPSTEILMVSWAIDDEPVQLWDLYDGAPPERLVSALRDPTVLKHAFNAAFERVMFRECWHIDTAPEEWRCTMVHAWYLAFAGGLGEVGRQMGQSIDKQKQDIGRRLIQKFCKPQPKNHKIRRHTRDTAPEDWAQFREYCRQDTVSERDMEGGLSAYPVPEHIWAEYALDQRINDRGVPVDPALIQAAVAVDQEAKAALKSEMNALTGLDNANSVQQLSGWLSTQGVDMPDMRKETLEGALKHINGLPAELIRMRLMVSQTSTTKWAAFERARMSDNRVRGMFSFGGAQRTLRWAGRLVQLHNLKRGWKNADEMAGLLLDPHAAAGLFHEPIDLLANTIRTAITAPPGRALLVSDLGSIESRVLGWLAQCFEMNRIFAEGRDTYRAFGSEYFHRGEDEITGEERTFCKPAVLGCGYQLGWEGLISYAEGYGVELSEAEAKRLVRLFRDLYPEVVSLWYWLVDAFTKVITYKQPIRGYSLTIYMAGPFLRVRLQSGRDLSYYQPEMRLRTPPWGGEKRPAITYMGRNQYTGQWQRISTHGGKIVENIVQALARDVLMYHMQLLDSQGAQIVGHVHDEVIIDVASDNALVALPHVEAVMSMSPPWAPDLLLGAEGFITQRYKKG